MLWRDPAAKRAVLDLDDSPAWPSPRRTALWWLRSLPQNLIPITWNFAHDPQGGAATRPNRNEFCVISAIESNRWLGTRYPRGIKTTEIQARRTPSKSIQSELHQFFTEDQTSSDGMLICIIYNQTTHAMRTIITSRTQKRKA